jgi:cysteine desulfurase
VNSSGLLIKAEDSMMPAYLDCNATTPVEEEVAREVYRFLVEEYGNPASPVHMYGTIARMAVEKARRDVAALIKARAEEVIFTSGATESNNLALLGLAKAGIRSGRTHIICSAIEHKAVLEPAESLKELGFEVTLVPVCPSGIVSVEALAAALRQDTLCVSIMHVNNETGVVQPLDQVTEILADHPAWLHVDAAQGFGKELELLRLSRIDLISISGHKIFGPKGVGALIRRNRDGDCPPLSPLMLGGGQEQGLRPGTLAAHSIVGLGAAARIAQRDHQVRSEACRAFKQQLLEGLEPLDVVIHGDPQRTLPHTLNLSIPGVEAHTLLSSLKDLLAFSNGSACTAHTQEPSHVLQAMGVKGSLLDEAIRLSWCHLTEPVDWSLICSMVQQLPGGSE